MKKQLKICRRMIFSHSYSFLSYDTGELEAEIQRSRRFQRDIHASHSTARGRAVLLLLSVLRKETKRRAKGTGFRFGPAITNFDCQAKRRLGRVCGRAALPLSIEIFFSFLNLPKKTMKKTANAAIENGKSKRRLPLKESSLDVVCSSFQSFKFYILPFLLSPFHSILPVENAFNHLKIPWKNFMSDRSFYALF